MMTKHSLLLLSFLLGPALPARALEIVQPTTITREHGAIEVVLFFTTVCEPCREALPAWNRLVTGADALDLDVSFRAISGELSQDIVLFLEEDPIEGEVLSDPAVDLARAYGLRRLPSMVIVRPGEGAEILAPNSSFLGLSIDQLQTILAECFNASEDPVTASLPLRLGAEQEAISN